jgi:hypothetical protein
VVLVPGSQKDVAKRCVVSIALHKTKYVHDIWRGSREAKERNVYATHGLWKVSSVPKNTAQEGYDAKGVEDEKQRGVRYTSHATSNQGHCGESERDKGRVEPERWLQGKCPIWVRSSKRASTINAECGARMYGPGN